MPVKKSKSKARNTRPKEYKGVLYKSTLEAYTAKALDEAGLALNYEQEYFQLLDKFECPAFCLEYRIKKSKGFPAKQNVMQEIKQKVLGAIYTPDFTDLSQGWVIECKGQKSLGDFSLRFKLFKRHLCENNLAYRIYMPNNPGQVDECIAHILATNT